MDGHKDSFLSPATYASHNAETFYKENFPSERHRYARWEIKHTLVPGTAPDAKHSGNSTITKNK